MSAISRRQAITATSAAGLAGAAVVVSPTPALAAPTGAIELIAPFRLQDSRTMEPYKYGTGARDGLSTPQFTGQHGVILNVTITETEGEGYFRIADKFQDPPETSTINWYTDGQTVANMAIVPMTSPGIKVQGGGSGLAHLIIDVLGFIT